MTQPVPLTRSLGLAGVLLLTLSVTTPASSVFVIVPGMFQVAGAGAVWATLIAALVCVATAVIYAELSSAWPVAGGEYVAVAQTIGPCAGFVMLGINIFSNVLFPPVAALGVAAVLGRIVPGLPQVPVAMAVIAAATGLSVLNIRLNAVVTGCFLAAEMAALAAVTWLGWAHPATPVVPHLPRTDVSPAAIGVAATIALFAFNGYGVAVYFAEEMHQASRRIARTVLLASAVTIASIAAPILALAWSAPDLFGRDDPFGLMVARFGPAWLADAVTLAVALAIVNAIIASILSCARFFYSTARDRCWGMPLDGWLGLVHPRLGSPWLGTLLVGAVMLAACLLPFTFLLVVNGTGLVVIYAGMALAALVGRRNGRLDRATWRAPLHPLAPLLTLAALAIVVWTSWQDPEEGRPGLIATAVEVVLSALYYRLVLHRRDGGWRIALPAGSADHWMPREDSNLN